jgi:phospholipid-translocating ATPase
MYKNLLIVLFTFSYMFYSDYSGQPLFDPGLIIFYNLAFTSLPVLALGVLENDITAESVIKYP